MWQKSKLNCECVFCIVSHSLFPKGTHNIKYFKAHHTQAIFLSFIHSLIHMQKNLSFFHFVKSYVCKNKAELERKKEESKRIYGDKLVDGQFFDLNHTKNGKRHK